MRKMAKRNNERNTLADVAWLMVMIVTWVYATYLMTGWGWQ